MKSKFLVVLFLIVFSTTACSNTVFEKDDYIKVDIKELKQNPEIYKNKKLLIKGYLSSHFDGYVDKNNNPVTDIAPFCLYENKEAAIAFDGKKCVSISWDYSQKISSCVNEYASFYAELGEYYLSTKRTTTDLGLVNIVAVNFDTPNGISDCL